MKKFKIELAGHDSKEIEAENHASAKGAYYREVVKPAGQITGYTDFLKAKPLVTVL